METGRRCRSSATASSSSRLVAFPGGVRPWCDLTLASAGARTDVCKKLRPLRSINPRRPLVGPDPGACSVGRQLRERRGLLPDFAHHASAIRTRSRRSDRLTRRDHRGAATATRRGVTFGHCFRLLSPLHDCLSPYRRAGVREISPVSGVGSLSGKTAHKGLEQAMLRALPRAASSRPRLPRGRVQRRRGLLLGALGEELRRRSRPHPLVNPQPRVRVRERLVKLALSGSEEPG